MVNWGTNRPKFPLGVALTRVRPLLGARQSGAHGKPMRALSSQHQVHRGNAWQKGLFEAHGTWRPKLKLHEITRYSALDSWRLSLCLVFGSCSGCACAIFQYSLTSKLWCYRAQPRRKEQTENTTRKHFPHSKHRKMWWVMHVNLYTWIMF